MTAVNQDADMAGIRRDSQNFVIGSTSYAARRLVSLLIVKKYRSSTKVDVHSYSFSVSLSIAYCIGQVCDLSACIILSILQSRSHRVIGKVFLLIANMKTTDCDVHAFPTHDLVDLYSSALCEHRPLTLKVSISSPQQRCLSFLSFITAKHLRYSFVLLYY